MVRFTGAGSEALHELTESKPPNDTLEKAIVEICELAKARKVRLLFDAEQASVQPGIDVWTLDFQRRYNHDVPGKALVYGTYQAYARSTPVTLAKHLAAALNEQFTLGVKLVRGAYLGSDPRHLFWAKKEDTDKVYNDIARCLMRRTYGGFLTPFSGIESQNFPEVNVVLASHNLETVQKAIALRKEQLDLGQERIPMVYGQLMGMADYVSCELILNGRTCQELQKSEGEETEIPQAYKYLVWGTVGECLKYLLRRAEENRDAVSRTEESRLALRNELGRRLFGG